MNKGKVIAVYDCNKYTNVVLSDGRTIKSKWGSATKSIEGKMISWTTSGDWSADEWFNQLSVSTEPKKADQYRSALEANSKLVDKIEELEIKLVDADVALGEMPTTIAQLQSHINDLNVQLNLANSEAKIAYDKQKNAEALSKKTMDDCNKQLNKNTVAARESIYALQVKADAEQRIKQAMRSKEISETRASSANTMSAIFAIGAIIVVIITLAATQ